MLNAFFPANIGIIIIHSLNWFIQCHWCDLNIGGGCCRRSKKILWIWFQSTFSERKKLILLIEKGFVCVCVCESKRRKIFFSGFRFSFSHKRCWSSCQAISPYGFMTLFSLPLSPLLYLSCCCCCSTRESVLPCVKSKGEKVKALKCIKILFTKSI